MLVNLHIANRLKWQKGATMQQIKDDRQRRMRLLLTSLRNDIQAAGRGGPIQPHDLEAHAKAVQLEFNALHNAGAPISSLTNEILARIFEAGMLQSHCPTHFGLTVSHLSRRFRDVAIATPSLWNSVVKFILHQQKGRAVGDLPITNVVQGRPNSKSPTTAISERGNTSPSSEEVAMLIRSGQPIHSHITPSHYWVNTQAIDQSMNLIKIEDLRIDCEALSPRCVLNVMRIFKPH